MQQLIEKYRLVPHPEGGYFREVFRSTQRLYSSVAEDDRDAVTHIYFLLAGGQISRFHKVLHDEIWNFYEGDPLRLLKYDGAQVTGEMIGADCNRYASLVDGGVYQAAESTGEYSLVGCTVAPGFDFADFSFLGDIPETAADFVRRFPEYESFL